MGQVVEPNTVCFWGEFSIIRGRRRGARRRRSPSSGKDKFWIWWCCSSRRRDSKATKSSGGISRPRQGTISVVEPKLHRYSKETDNGRPCSRNHWQNPYSHSGCPYSSGRYRVWSSEPLRCWYHLWEYACSARRAEIWHVDGVWRRESKQRRNDLKGRPAESYFDLLQSTWIYCGRTSWELCSFRMLCRFRWGHFQGLG